MKKPDFSAIEQAVGEHTEKFEAFRALLREYNQRYNLTAVTQDEDILYKHFYDSLAGEFLFRRNAAAVEVGSGGGFPSIPVMLVREDIRFTLIESVKKKCAFLRVCVRELGLNVSEIIDERAETVAKKENYREKFDVCCARAVAPLSTLSEYCIPFLKKGGQMIAYKGTAEEELEQGERAIRILGGRVKEIIRYELPEGYGKRTLVVAEKEKKTAEKYPRGQGKERRTPLG